MSTLRDRGVVLGMLGILGLATAVMVVAGPLNPPAGPVASTYKTLSEVEPRIAINSTNTPGGVGETFLISQPGSYYLTGNLTMTASKHAIAVATGDVTIDLNGYTITGVSGSGYGVVGYGGAGRIVVRNGSFRIGFSPSVSVGSDSLVENIMATQAGLGVDAISVGDRGVVRNCRVATAASAVLVGNQCVVEGLSAVGVVTGVNAISKVDLVVRDCAMVGVVSGTGVNASHRVSVSNTRLQAFGIGVAAGDFAVAENTHVTAGVFGVVAGKNATLRNVEAMTMSSQGVSVSDASVLEHVSVRSCTDAGIVITSDCTLNQCNVSACNQTGFIAGSRNTFVDCTSAKNTAGHGFLVTDGNRFSNCFADENTGDGFNGRFGNILRGCGARANVGDGIEGGSGTYVMECRLDGNGSGAGVGANIRITGDVCRIEGNSLIGADFGIQTVSSGNVIIRNSSRGSANGYGGISAGNDVGPIGSAATATSPWANILY